MTRRTYYDSLSVSDPDRMIVPIAIREDLTARLQIPVNLTLAEAEKIARVVIAYAASAIEAAIAGETPESGSTEGESATAESRDAQGPSQ